MQATGALGRERQRAESFIEEAMQHSHLCVLFAVPLVPGVGARQDNLISL